MLIPIIETTKNTRGLILSTISTMSAIQNQNAALNNTAIVMGQSFDAAKNGDLFYLPPEAFQNPEFQRGLKMFLSPDGKSARAFITHPDDPRTPQGNARGGAKSRPGRAENVVPVERQNLSRWDRRHLRRHGRRRQI